MLQWAVAVEAVIIIIITITIADTLLTVMERALQVFSCFPSYLSLAPFFSSLVEAQFLPDFGVKHRGMWLFWFKFNRVLHVIIFLMMQMQCVISANTI